MPTRPQPAKTPPKRPVPVVKVKAGAVPAAKKTARKAIRRSLIPNALAGQFIAWYRMDFTRRIHVIRSGVPAQRVGELSSVMHMPKEALMDALGLSRATINRKVQRDQMLSPEESERVMGVQALIGQVQAMIDTDIAHEFDAAQWLASWLTAPLPALDGATPSSFLDTVEGQKYIGN